MKKVIDSFMFFNEFDVLKLRLSYLNDIVDHFIIVESNYTHSGKPKPYYLDEIWNEIPKEIQRKIIRLKYEPDISKFKLPEVVIEGEVKNYDNDYWKLEREQRDLITQHLSHFSLDDFFMVSDVDEIPRKEIITSLLNNNFVENVASCEMFYYNFKSYCPNYWPGTVFSTVSNAIKKGCDYFRSNRFSLTPIPNAGWHFTYFGGVERIKHKLECYAHQEYNRDEYKNEQNIEDLIKSKKHFLRRGEEFGDDFIDYSFTKYPEDLRKLIINIFPQETYTDHPINVSFSIIPSRFNNLEMIIRSFLSQTLRPNKIIVTIPKQYHKFSYQPEEIENICKKYSGLVDLLYVDMDYGPATKIYGALKSLEMYPNSNVIVCDDDVVYDERLIECYLKSFEVDGECAWSTGTETLKGNYLHFLSNSVPKLQGVGSFFFNRKILEKLNSSNFEEHYINFLSKNTNIKSLDDVFLHDDYFISILLYELQVPVKFFYLRDPVYDGIGGENQIHESIKCHSDEIQLIQKIYHNYENSYPIIQCIFTKVNGEKIGEYLVKGELDVNDYHSRIIDINKQYGPFKIAIEINSKKPMNTLLDKKTSDLQEFYDWQIKYDKMYDDHVDYLFRLKYWNNFHPKVIYDIGSNYLSWYKLASNVWRDAKIYCVDACSEFANTYPRYNVDYAIELLSDRKEQIEFWENPMCPGLCTMYPVNENYDDARVFHNEHLRKTIRQTKTLDELVNEKGWMKPDLIKIDVQGAEVNILKGSSSVLENCNHLILEVQNKEFSTGAPMLEDVKQFMNSIGFALFHHIGYNGGHNCDGDYHFVRQNILPK
jgi:beta-1,4-mannosyl-glycoprotein beta-1,4-N-acetylglucosaminyltransferase